MSFLIAMGNLLMLLRAISIDDSFFAVNYVLQSSLWMTIVILIFVYRR